MLMCHVIMTSSANAKYLTPFTFTNALVKFKDYNISGYLLDNFQNHVTLMPPLFAKLVNLTKFG